MPIHIKHLGLIDYDDAMAIMKDCHQKRCNNLISDTILVLEHNPVITKGRRLHGQKVPFESDILGHGIQIKDADRGGLLTYHGPGQIVIYFIVKFSDHFAGISDMIQFIEQSLLCYLERFKLNGRLIQEHPGIWIGSQKIASIGLRVSKGVTSHGISFNVSNDLSVYRLFDPCGMSGDTMTNLKKILKDKMPTHDLKIQKLSNELSQFFVRSFDLKHFRSR